VKFGRHATNFSKKRAASKFRIGERVCTRFSVVKAKAAHSTETFLPIYQNTRRHIQEYHNLEVIVGSEKLLMRSKV
jgi:hypothetical protein